MGQEESPHGVLDGASIARARERLGLSQQRLALNLTLRMGASVTGWVVERWETPNPDRQRPVPERYQEALRSELGLDDCPEQERDEIQGRTPASWLVPAEPPTCADDLCACRRWDCTGCGTRVETIGPRRPPHTCPFLAVVTDPDRLAAVEDQLERRHRRAA